MNKFYITTAIAYVNAAPHMGHALEFVLTDAIARYRRLMGEEVHFLTGTDEHGVKIYNAAKKIGMEPLAFVNQNAETFKNLREVLDLSYDDFIRTSERQRHWAACQKLWLELVKQDDIYEKEYEGAYCEGCETFLLPRDLVDGKCPIHHRAPSLVKEKNYFFRLSKYSEQIGRLIESDTLKIIPATRKQEILSMIKEGLTDVSFSRPREVLPWGVDVPGDDSQVMYVWCDALTNYISALGFAENGSLFKKFWPADLHVIGKDIVRFHAGIWIGMLLSAGIKLPKAILVHGFITHNGEKMSKTLGNVVNPVDTVNQYGTDALRYYFLREITNGRDGDFSDKLFIERYNTDLANNLGNLVNRVHTLIVRNGIQDFSFGLYSDVYKAKIDATWKKYVSDMNDCNLHEAVFHVWRLVDFANKIIDDEKPWILLKSDPEKAKAVLCNLLETIRHISIMISPVMPKSAMTIRQQIGLSPIIDIEKEKGWGAVTRWPVLGPGGIIFPRIEKKD